MIPSVNLADKNQTQLTEDPQTPFAWVLLQRGAVSGAVYIQKRQRGGVDRGVHCGSSSTNGQAVDIFFSTLFDDTYCEAPPPTNPPFSKTMSSNVSSV